MKKKGFGESEGLDELVRKRKIKRILRIAIGISILIIILIIGFLSYSYFKSPEKQIGIGADISQVVISEDGEYAYVKLNAGINSGNITGVKFIFKDASGNEYVYETSEGIKEISTPFKKSWLDFFGKPKLEGVYDYVINVSSLNLENLNEITEVDVSFKYETQSGTEIETPSLDTQKPTTPKPTSSSGGGGGGSGGGGGGSPPAGCTATLTCVNYPNQCGVDLSDGCSNVLNCSENCVENQTCYTGEGINYSVCINKSEECIKNNDFCEDSFNLTEYYCYLNSSTLKTEIKNRTINCEHGCENSSCLEKECDSNNECDEDYISDNYCDNNSAYHDFHNFTCINGRCNEETTIDLIEACGYGCEDGVCVDELDIQISVATLKHSYNIGEEVDLTDPPENPEKKKSFFELITGFSILENIKNIGSFFNLKGSSFQEESFSFEFPKKLNGKITSMGSSSLETIDLNFLVSSTDFVPLSYVKPSDKLSIQADKSEGIFQIEGLELDSSIPGFPILPVKVIKLLVPENFDTTKINIITGDKQEIQGDYFIEPAGIAAPINGSVELKSPVPNETIYNSDEAYPVSPIKNAFVQKYRGYNILFITLIPIKYYPASGRVYYYPFMNIEVETMPKPSSLNELPPKFDSDTINKLSEIVDNKEMISSYEYGRYGALDSQLPLGDYEYIIITNNALKGSTANYTFQDLIALKQAKGLTAKIVTVEEDIYPNYNVSEANGGNQDKIRQFIRDAYNNWGTRWVLLGGDVEVVPARGVYAVGDGDVQTNLPTDMYYACLDGSWNGDGDSLFGESNDGIDSGDIDLVSEIYIGRAPVSNANEISNFVAKTILYETNNHPNYSTVVLLGEKLDSITYGGHSMIAIRDKTLPEDWNLVERYETSTTSFSKEQVISDLNDSPNMVTHAGHGSSTYNAKINNNDVVNLTNSFPYFMHSPACYSGSFDTTDVCIAEQHVVSEHGAFAVVMNARLGYYGLMTVPAYSHYFALEFFDAVFNEEKLHLGEANADSKMDNLWHVGTGGNYRYIYFETNLFGDPETSFQLGGYSPTPGIAIRELGGTRVYEEGETTDHYTLVLTAQPEAKVIITLEPCNQVSVNPKTMNFTTANWNVERSVFVSAVDDEVVEGPHICVINHLLSSDDPEYNGLSVDSLIVQITDNDLDEVPPTVTIDQAAGQSDPTSASIINFIVVFSELVSYFDTGDVILSGTAPGTLVGEVTGNGTTYNVAVSGMTGSGTVIATVAEGVAYDWANNFNTASTSTDNSVTFNFAAYTITSSAGANGVINPSGLIPVVYGANQTFTITANIGYHIEDILVDNLSVGTVLSYTFSNITTNHTIEASFSSQCGNNIKESIEECDGTDDSICEDRCSEICECHPESKIVNNEDFDITGNLIMILQKNNSGWVDEQIVVNKQITIPANSVLKLDNEWNPSSVVINEAGTYRVNVSFESNEQVFSSNWEFACDYCTLELVNTSWSDWTNISCLEDNKMNQSREKIQYDANNCGEIENQTFVEYRSNLSCEYNDSQVLVNQKDLSLYSDKQAFLISTENWQEVLSLVPVSVWTEQTNSSSIDCQRAYGGSEGVCAYPTLMYNLENNSYTYYYGNPENLTDDSNYRENLSIYENFVVYSDNRTGNFDIYLYDLNDNQENVIINTGLDELNPVIYGDNIIYELSSGGVSSLYLYDLVNNISNVLISDSFNQTNPSIYNEKIVYQDNRNGDWEIYMYDLNNELETRLTYNETNQVTPEIYEDLVVWSDNRKGSFNIFLYNLSNSIETQISSNTRNHSVPDIYGDRIVWADYSMAGRADIYYYVISEDKTYRVTTNWREDTNPKLYGDRLVWQDYRNGNFDIYMYDFENPKEIQITTNSNHQTNPIIWNDKIVWLDLTSNKRNLYYFNYTGWYEEYELSHDIDSIILFLQQYEPDNLKIINETTDEITNVLVSEPDFGAGINENDIGVIQPQDYFEYWTNYYNVVYVEESYSLALTASVLASYLNAPLIIENSVLDKDEYINGKNLTCIGNVNRDCNINYNLTEVEDLYMDLTNTDKIILLNPTDLTKYASINLPTTFYTEKTTWPIKRSFTQTSMSAPFLASAKHELIAQTTYTDYKSVNNTIKSYYQKYGGNETFNFLTVFAAPNAISISGETSGARTKRAADPAYYADVNGDHNPDVGVGRIQGINPSDVSSYVSRSLFYDKLNHKFNNITLMVGNGADDHNGAFFFIGRSIMPCWASIFREEGYFVDCALRESSSEECFNYTNKQVDWPSLMLNKDYIYQGAHGSSSYGGIHYYQIPKMQSTITMLESCSPCSSYSYNSYCNNVIRKGGIGIVSAISTSYSGNPLPSNFANNIYYYNMSIGDAFSDGCNTFSIDYWMYTLLGDPSFELNQDDPFDQLLVYYC